MRLGPRSLRRRRLFELFQVDQVAVHFLRREVVEQAQHSLEQQSVVAAAELPGHDDPGMGAPAACHASWSGAKSRMLKVRMARCSAVAKASCSSSDAVSFPASSVVKTSYPRPRRSTASRVMM